jgi:formiminoglutamase
MSLSDFFSPVNLEKFTPKAGFYTSQLGLKTTFFQDNFPDLGEDLYDMAILGVQDDRASVNNEGCALAPDYFREQFYTLHEGPYNTRLVDLGNIKMGASISDTYVALKTVVSELVKLNIVPVIIGGG